MRPVGHWCLALASIALTPQPARSAAEGVIQSQIGAPDRSTRSPQVSPSGSNDVGARQLTTGSDIGRRTPQASAGQRSAAAPPALSTRSQGRNTTSDPVRGSDRCDPAAGGPPPSACDQPIETRADEFPGPAAAPLSPEQRLLAGRQELRSSTDPRQVARRVGDPEGDATAAEAVVASGLLPDSAAARQAQAPQRSPDALSAEVAGVIEAIVGGQLTLPPAR